MCGIFESFQGLFLEIRLLARHAEQRVKISAAYSSKPNGYELHRANNAITPLKDVVL